MHHMPQASFRKGFTLLEIIVAMAILSGLITILGKFSRQAIKKVVGNQENLESQLQSSRIVRLLEDDLRFMPPSEVDTVSSGVYSWVKYFDDEGTETPTRCVYALDGQGNIHRILLPSHQSFDISMLTKKTIITNGIGKFLIAYTYVPDANIRVCIENRQGTRTRTLTWFPAGK
ncbi:MAG: type II secretion system GspH family protein [Puniceicoccales bacterium]|nr:type II secretion system GspH family protein [Puniceicoccales bacterium]